MKANFIKGFYANIPIGFSVMAYGLVLGILAGNKGVTFFELIFMNLATFAGSAEFLMVELWNDPLPFVQILIAVFAVNLRYLLVGASLTPLFKGKSVLHKATMMHLVADENWAVTMSKLKNEKITPYFLLGGGICLLIFWTVGTLSGHQFGELISNPYALALDFVIIIIFTGLAMSFYEGKNSILPWTVAGIMAYLFFILIPGKWYIVLGGLSGSLVYAFKKSQEVKK